MSFLFVVLLMVAAIVAWAIYQYKVEKKARQARYDKVRKRTDMSKPYHPLTNTGWSRGSDFAKRGSGYSNPPANHPANQHYHHYHDVGSPSSSSDSSCSGGSSGSSGSCD